MKLELSRHIFEKPSNIKCNPLNAKLNPICHLLALLGAHHILHVNRISYHDNVSRIRVNPFPANVENMKIRSLRTDLFHADGRTDKNDES